MSITFFYYFILKLFQKQVTTCFRTFVKRKYYINSNTVAKSNIYFFESTVSVRQNAEILQQSESTIL